MSERSNTTHSSHACGCGHEAESAGHQHGGGRANGCCGEAGHISTETPKQHDRRHETAAGHARAPHKAGNAVSPAAGTK